MMKSGGPNCFVSCQPSSLGHCFGAGMSFGSPCGAPASTHCEIVLICSSESEISFLNCWMPTVLSRCHGGMLRVTTRCLMDLAHGRVSSKVTKDIGAIEPLRWHASHFSWRMGATSLV